METTFRRASKKEMVEATSKLLSKKAPRGLLNRVAYHNYRNQGRYKRALLHEMVKEDLKQLHEELQRQKNPRNAVDVLKKYSETFKRDQVIYGRGASQFRTYVKMRNRSQKSAQCVPVQYSFGIYRQNGALLREGEIRTQVNKNCDEEEIYLKLADQVFVREIFRRKEDEDLTIVIENFTKNP